MSLIVDQTWVSEWTKGQPTQEQKSIAKQWLRSQPEFTHKTLFDFPPLAVVGGVKALEVPYPHSVGIVVGYYDDGKIAVSQDPSSPPVPCRPEHLMVVGYWKGLSPATVEALLHN